MLQVPVNFNPRWYQLELFQAMDGIKDKPETKCKNALIVWHRQTGKDKTCFAYMCKEAARVSGSYVYAFPDHKIAERDLWKQIDRDGFRILDHMPKEIAKFNNSKMIIAVNNGPIQSHIYVVGYDRNPDILRGMTLKGLVVSEAAFCPALKLFLDAAGESLRQNDGWMILNSTPNGRNEFYDYYIRACNSPAWFCSLKQSYDRTKDGYTGIVTKEQITELREVQGHTEQFIQQEVGCNFNVGATGAYYIENVDLAKKQGRISSFPYDQNYLVDTFWDIGKSDDTVIWFTQQVGHSIHIIDYYENRGKDPDHYAKVLAEKNYLYNVHYLPHDAKHDTFTGCAKDILEHWFSLFNISTETRVMEKLQKKQDGINLVRNRFRLYHFNSINQDVAKGLRRIENYKRKYNRLTGKFSEDPDKDGNDHAADALVVEAQHTPFISQSWLEPKKHIKVNSKFDPWKL
jgi:hypothetical protein